MKSRVAPERGRKAAPRGKPFAGGDDPRRHPGFPKGVSGNPGGMTADVAAARDEARRLAAEFAPTVLRRLAKILLSPADGDAVSVAAGREILDRALGKASQPLEHSGPGVVAARMLSREDMAHDPVLLRLESQLESSVAEPVDDSSPPPTAPQLKP